MMPLLRILFASRRRIIFLFALWTLFLLVLHGVSIYYNAPLQQPMPDFTEVTHWIPDLNSLKNMTFQTLEGIYHRHITNIEVFCKNVVRNGKLGDGGWHVCEDPEYIPIQPCLVYSFGINYDFSFDDHVARRYGCEVHSFDPSMQTKDHQRNPLISFHALGLADKEIIFNKWPLKSLNQIKENLGHVNKTIDILKIDIEMWEWSSLWGMLQSDSLDHVRQLSVEFHLQMGQRMPTQTDYVGALTILRGLQDHGFRIFWSHHNPTCQFISNSSTVYLAKCHEVNMVKVAV